MDLNGDAPAAAAAEPEDREPASGEGHPKDDDEDLADRLTHIYDRMQVHTLSYVFLFLVFVQACT